MMNRYRWARAAALTASFAIVAAAVPSGAVFAQETPAQELEQARSGEDGTSGAGATSGNMSSGNAGRDKDGNGGNASAGEAGAAESPEADSAALPENAELLDALGILDEVTANGLTVLSGLDIPVELLPAPVENPTPAAPTDINTGGQGGSGQTSSISTEAGDGSAPAGGSTSSAAEDGVGSSASGERDRPRKNNNGSDGTATTTDGGTDTASSTG